MGFSGGFRVPGLYTFGESHVGGKSLYHTVSRRAFCLSSTCFSNETVKTKCLRLLVTHMLLQMIEERLKHNTSESPTFTRLPLVCVCVCVCACRGWSSFCVERERAGHTESTHTHTCVRAHTGRQKKCNTQRTSLQVSPCRICSCS